MDIKTLANPDEKSTICNDVLRALPGWFEIESAIVDYVRQVREMPFYAAFDNDKAIGFAALKAHSRFTAEIYAMGVLRGCHRRGIGRQLIACCESHCKQNNIEFQTPLDTARKNNRDCEKFHFPL